MKAIVQTGYGSPDLLELREVEPPAVGDDTVLVRVHAASVNAADGHLLGRIPHLIGALLRQPRSRVRGFDLAGSVEAVGRRVTRFSPGEPVFGIGVGSFAELSASTEERLAAKPSNLSFEQAAAIPMAATTAIQGLRDTAGLKSGERVLVYGAGGGVGTFAVQIAKALGGRVTAVSRAENLEMLRSIGADAVVDYESEDFAASGDRYELFFDVGANRSFADCRKVVVPGGRVVVAGAPRTIPAIVGRMLRGRLVAATPGPRIESFMARMRHDDLVALKELAEAGRLLPVIDRTCALGEVAEAIRYLGSGRVRGKVVVRVR